MGSVWKFLFDRKVILPDRNHEERLRISGKRDTLRALAKVYEGQITTLRGQAEEYRRIIDQLDTEIAALGTELTRLGGEVAR